MRIFQWNWRWNWNPGPKRHFAIALTLTILTAILSIVSYAYSIRQITQNPIVKGIVVNSVPNADGMHTPIIEYNSPTKGRTRFKSRLATRPQNYFIGDSVEVILVGQDFKPKLKSFFSVYGLPVFLIVFASISAIGSTAIYHFRIKK